MAGMQVETSEQKGKEGYMVDRITSTRNETCDAERKGRWREQAELAAGDGQTLAIKYSSGPTKRGGLKSLST